MTTQPTSKPSSSFTEHSFYSSNSMEEFNENNDLTEIGDILLSIKENETIQLMIDEFICGCKYCLMDRLKQTYQEACEELNLYQQSSDMDNEAFEHWFKNFEERFKDEIATFPFKCEKLFGKQPILTHEQEQSLLKDAHENTTETDCVCQECMLREVSYLAYKLASDKNIPCPESWKRDKKAGSRWLKDFKVKHKDSLSFFPRTCKIASFFTEIFKSSNSSREKIRKYNVPIKIKDILLFTKEEEILKQMIDDKQSVCGCKYCLMDRLKKVYQEAREELCCPQSDMDNEAVENWFQNFEERYKDEISILPIRCGRSEESITKQQSILSIEEELLLLTQIKANSTTEDCICQKCLLQNVAFLAYEVASDNNKPYPESWKKHEKAESQWLKNFTDRHKKEISKFPSRCKLSEEAITKQQSIFSVEEELSLLTQVKEAAKDCTCQECLLTDISLLAYKVASYNNIPYPESWKKHKRAESQWLKDFTERHKNEISKFPLICKLMSVGIFTAQWSSKIIFTFVQERSLLVDLEANSTTEDCICKKCVLEKLPFLVYKLACEVNLKNRAKQFPKSWNRCKKAGQHWMEDFIRRHEKEFAKLSFPCKINSSEPSTSKGQSSLN